MKRFRCAVFLAVVCCLAASAAPVCTSGMGLPAYIANYNSFANACQIGNLLFWDFSWAPSPGIPGFQLAAPAANTVTVTTSGLGLRFNFGGVFDIDQAANLTMYANLKYQVQAVDPGNAIDGAFLATLGHEDTTSGSTFAKVFEHGCVAGYTVGGSETCPGGVTPPTINNDVSYSLGGDITDTVVTRSGVLNQTKMYINDYVYLRSRVDATGPAPHAGVSWLENQFSMDIPEPLTMLLLGSGLLAIGFLRRPFRR